MANPLDTAVAPNRPLVDLTERCRARNAEPLTRRMSRWYFVGMVNNKREITHLEGTDGDMAWKMLDGTFQDFMGWEEKRMNGYRRWLSGCIERGGGNPHHAPQLTH